MTRYVLLSGIILASVLSGCDNAKTVLGFDRNNNDEFAVLITPPELSLPSNFDNLPDPVARSSGIDTENKSTERARKAAMGQFSTAVAQETNTNISAGEAELLMHAKAHEKDDQIRQSIEKDAAKEKDNNKSIVKDLLNIKDSGAKQALDPFEEKKRLDQEKS